MIFLASPAFQPWSTSDPSAVTSSPSAAMGIWNVAGPYPDESATRFTVTLAPNCPRSRQATSGFGSKASTRRACRLMWNV